MKKIVSLILVALMLVSMIPMAAVSVSAADDVLKTETVGGVTYKTFSLYDPAEYESMVTSNTYRDYETNAIPAGITPKDAVGVMIDVLGAMFQKVIFKIPQRTRSV